MQQKLTSFFSLFGAVLRLGVIFLLSFAVPAWTCADAHLEAPPAQNKSPRKKMNSSEGQNAFLGFEQYCTI